MKLVKTVIGLELEKFELFFVDAFKSDVFVLDKILRYITKQKGKQIRPLFVLLCARLGGTINEQTYRAALFVEMLHTSSLVHDDIVDDSLERRGVFSIHALWKNKAAVLAGDVIFSKSISLLITNGDHRTLEIFSSSIRRVIEGELLQIGKSKNLNFNEDIYFEIIKGKTATLLAAACAAGAASTFTDDSMIRKLHLFGEKLGIAFQIKDDLLDYRTADIGKPTRNDIKEKKLTLPLIYALNNCDYWLRKKLIRIIKHKNTDEKSVDYLVNEVEKIGGITYAEKKMKSFSDEALSILYDFPESHVRAALVELVAYTTDRIN
ncbi:MAG: polyprenyl synthetase [Marivirga sp.]|nr:polyprenyl synthetase [Marivirga sp.]